MSAIQEANAIQRKLDTADRQHMTALAKEKERHEKRVLDINDTWQSARKKAVAGASSDAQAILAIEAAPVTVTPEDIEPNAAA